MVIMNNVNTTERLIQEVRLRPPLWDQRNLNYHNRVVVNALWQDIADLLQVNKETVKVKWKGLRDTYRRELKKQRSNAHIQHNENARDPSWTHYSSMNFLREYMGSNNNHAELFQFQGWATDDMTADEATSPTHEAMSPFVPPAAATNTCEVGTNKDGSVDSMSGDETMKMEPKTESYSPAPPHEENRDEPMLLLHQQESPKRRQISRLSRLKELRLRSRLSRKHTRTQGGGTTRFTGVTQIAVADDSDDDLYFFKSLLPYVKSLPPTRKLFLRSEIHNLVLREIMVDTNGSHSVIPLEHVTVGFNA